MGGIRKAGTILDSTIQAVPRQCCEQRRPGAGLQSGLPACVPTRPLAACGTSGSCESALRLWGLVREPVLREVSTVPGLRQVEAIVFSKGRNLIFVPSLVLSLILFRKVYLLIFFERKRGRETEGESGKK